MIRDVWPAILAMAAATYLSRCLTLAWFSSLPLPRAVERGLRHIPAGVLVALVAPQVLAPGGRVMVPWYNPDLLAGLLAAGTAFRTRSVPLTMLVGVVAALVLRRLMG